MKLITAESGVVIAGNWNYAIFNPEWVNKYLLPGEVLNVEIQIARFGSLKISSPEISVSVVENKLQILSKVESDEVFRKIANLAIKISEYLPHTPVTAFGINCHFQSEETKRLQELFAFVDANEWSQEGFIEINSQISRTYTFGKNAGEIKLIIQKTGNSYKLSFNDHFKVKTLSAIKEHLSEDEIISFRSLCNSLIEKHYVELAV